MKREITIPEIGRKGLGFFRLFVAVLLTMGMFFVPGVVSSREAHAAGTTDAANAGMDTAWAAWTQGKKTIPFTMNGATSVATVSRSDSVRLQFGVVVTVTDDPPPNQYTYLYDNGTGITSGTAYSIGTGSLKDFPKAYFAQGQVRQTTYYSSSNAVRAVATIDPIGGATLEYEQTLYFSPLGIVQTTMYKNVGTSPLSNFALINKIDTMLSDKDKIPVYYGSKKFQYFLRDPDNKVQRDLYVEATDGSGVASSRAAKYQGPNPSGMKVEGLDSAWGHADGDLAFGAGDSEIMFANIPQALAVGQTQSTQYRVFFKEHGAVNVQYLNKATKSPMQVPDSFKSAIVGDAGDPYSMTQPSINGYRSAGIADDSAPESGTLTADLPSPTIKYLYVPGESAVKYDGNGAESGATTDTIGTTNQSVKIAQNGFVHPGYSFTGWNTAADGTGTAYAAGDPFVLKPAELRLFAQWKADPLSISYDGNGADSGSTSGAVGITGQSVAVADNGFTRDGYTFTGWNTKADGSGTAYAEGDAFVLKPAESKLFAQWKADKAKVTYDGNGSASGSTNDTVGVTNESVTVADNGFARPGYSFVGWNTAADGSGTAYAAGDGITLSAPELKLFAQWKADSAVLSYDGNGSDLGSIEDAVGVTNESVTVADNAFTRSGYTFKGWNTAADGSGTAYAEGDAFVLQPAKSKLFAQWDADEAKVIYDGNGSDSGVTDDTVGVTDEKVAVADNGFMRSGYTFTGWNTAGDGSGTAYVAGDEVVLSTPDLKLFAQWKANEAKITYDGNGSESGSVDDTIGVTDQSVTVADNGFTRDGYTFTGWSTKADGSGTAYAEGDTFVLKPAESKLFAQWKADEAKVTYDGNGSESGSTDDTVGVTDEKVAVSINGFVHSGYTFTGWNTKADGSGTAYAEGDDVVLSPSGLKLFAQWKADPAVLMYDGNGADSGSTENTVGVTDQNVTVADNGFTRSGYSFSGWNSAADGSGTAYAEGDSISLTPGMATLFAQWDANEAKVTYDGNGSNSGSTDDTTGVTDEKVSIAVNGFVHDGYTFTGWNTAADGSGTAYAAGDEVTLTPSELKLFAQWKADPAVLMYDGNGADSGSTENTVGVTDQNVTVADNGFVARSGYSFTGWNTEADGSGTTYAEGDPFVLTPEVVTLFAQWKADEAKVTYDGNGSDSGSTDDTVGVTDESVKIADNGFARDGYTFMGWNTAADGSGTAYAVGDEVTLTPSELKLFAQWNADEAKITYNGNGSDSGSTDDTVGVTDEKVSVAVNGFVHDGYTFMGWNTKADGSGTAYVAGDEVVLSTPELKLFAQWDADPAVLMYDGNGADSGSVENAVGVTDESVTVSDNGFEHDGYMFTGWNTAADGSGTAYAEGDAFVLAPSDSKLYAQWKADEAKLIYDGNGSDSGSTDDIVGVTDESVTVSGNDFARSGYTFTGWNTKADGSGTAYAEGDAFVLKPAKSTLFAQWKADEAKLIYDGNGSDSGSMDDAVGVTDESVTVADNGFTRDGYTFTGWNTKADGSGTAYAEGDSIVLAPEMTTLFAQWEANETRLEYDGNGSDSGSTEEIVGVTDESVTVADNGFTRDGYTFTGWNTASDGSGAAYAEGDDYVLKPAKSTLFAQWDANEAALSYDGNGFDSGSTEEIVGVTDESVTVADNGFTRDGYTFTGWNTAADGSGTAYAEGDDYVLKPAGSTLFAQWKADEADITYDGNGSESGSTDDTVGVTDEKVSVAGNGFVHSGYTFKGWNSEADGSGTAYAAGDEVTLTPSELKLFAQWEADPAVLMYDGNGADSGSTENTVGVTDESVTVADSGFIRSGYSFSGWNSAADGSGAAYAEGDPFVLSPSMSKLFAQWKADPSAVAYDGNGSDSGSMDDAVGVTDESVTVADNGFTRDGYTFTGWNTKADGSGTAYAEGDAFVLKPAGSTLFAQWKADEADITYDGNGTNSGSTENTVGVTDEKVAVAKNGFTRDGYTFTGWNTAADGSGTAYAEGDEVVLAPSELKLFAQWKANPPKVTPSSSTTPGSPDSKVPHGASGSKLTPSASSEGVEKTTNSMLARTGAGVGIFAVTALLAAFVGAAVLLVSKGRHASVAGSHVSRRL